MKKILSLILALCLVFSLAACGCNKDAGNTAEDATNATDAEGNVIENKGELVIGYTIYDPMNFMEGNTLTGFDTEFAEAVCAKLGYTPVFQEIVWDNKFITLNAGEIDCIWNGMTISDEVKTNCLVSDAYVKNAQVVVMSKDAIANYTDVESLKGLKFTAEAGSAGEAAIKDNGLDANYVEIGTQLEALLAVNGGQADACVIDITMAKSMTADGTDYDNLGYSLELTKEEYGIGFRLEDTALCEDVNKAMAELNEDGTLTALAEKYGLNLAF